VKIYNLLRHIESYHRLDNEVQCSAVDVQQQSLQACADDQDLHDVSDSQYGTVDAISVQQSSDTSTVDISHNCIDDVHTEAVSLVAALRASSSIPYSAIPAVINSFNHMSSSLSDFFELIAESSLLEAGVDSESALSVMQTIHQRLECSHMPLDFLSSVYKQDAYFKSHDLFVKPEPVCFGARYESHSGTSKLVYDTFQYVSVEQTLKSLLQNKAYIEALLEDHVVPGVYRGYADGECAKLHKLFGNPSKFSIMIQLFYDGLGTTNPLRGQNTINNIGVFFYTIKNLPARYNSCFANVHLLALCYSEDLKKYGFDPVLEKFVHEINLLQNIGFEANVGPDGERMTVYASLCQVTGDNLALNGLLGYIESFSSDFFCTFCYTTQEMIQKHFRDDVFQRRTITEYEKDVKKISEIAGKATKNHCRGVKRDCALNRIDGYHVTENWSLDVMHIVLEGIIPVELSCILYGLCVECKLFDVRLLNDDINLFWGTMTVGKDEKPATLNKLLEPGQGLTPSMKAVQYWSLLKYLPVIFGKRVPQNNEHWNFLLHLCRLVDLLFAPRVTVGMIQYMKDVIEDHLNMYCELYSTKWQVKLRPKHHLLVHLPAVIQKSGPLVGMSCMRYELKNSFFKRSAHTACNFINICHTLANRHQQHVLYSLLSSLHIRDTVVVGRQTSVPVCMLAYCELLCAEFGVEATDDVVVTSKVTVAGVQYVKNNIILLDVHELGHVFGRISTFVCARNDEWYLVVEVISDDKFCSHYHAHAIAEVKPPAYKLVKFDELIDHHPLHCCTVNIGGSVVKLVRLPYHIFKL